MNILVIAPHPDDEVIGCGGAICLHTDRGDRVVAVFLTSGELALKQLSRESVWAIREREARAAARVLRLADTIFLRLPDWFLGDHLKEGLVALAAILERERPELIYLPHAQEQHPDHQAAARLLKRALLRHRLENMPELRGYEVWTPLREAENIVNISSVLTRKLRALRAHRSQLGSFDYVAAVKGLNRFRGAMSGKFRYAEAFEDVNLSPGFKRMGSIRKKGRNISSHRTPAGQKRKP